METEVLYTDEHKDALAVHLMLEGEKKLFDAMPDSFTAKKLEAFYLPEKKAYVVGLGKKEELKLDYYRRAGGKSVKLAAYYKIPAVHFTAQHLTDKEYIALAEGAVLANYSFDKYKSDDAKIFRVKKISFPSPTKKYSDFIHKSVLVCRNVHFVRDLVSENSDVVTPEFMEKAARKIAKKNRLRISVLREPELRKLGMNLLLAVGKASQHSPRLIMLEYSGEPHSNEKIMLVGKGICFDSGGLDLKPRESMLEMRMDMAGAAAVLGIMKSAAELKLRKNLVGVLAVTENIIGENAYRPKDIIRSFSGKTVENIDTDAEGRLVLADALNYGVKKYNPKLVVEFSTLTGSVVGTFGNHCAGMIASNASEFARKMLDAGMETYERVWELPQFEEYQEEVTGERSDFRSLGKTRYNGAIFGGVFLSKFVEGKPFIHIDIAGTAMIEEAKDYMPKDGTGFGVRLGIEFLKKV